MKKPPEPKLRGSTVPPGESGIPERDGRSCSEKKILCCQPAFQNVLQGDHLTIVSGQDRARTIGDGVRQHGIEGCETKLARVDPIDPKLEIKDQVAASAVCRFERKDIRPVPTQKRVITKATEQAVIAKAAFKAIIAILAGEGVIASAADQRVRTAAAFKPIVEQIPDTLEGCISKTRQPFEIAAERLARQGCRPRVEALLCDCDDLNAGCVDDENIVADTANHRIDACPAIDVIIAESGIDAVIAAASVDAVIPSRGQHRIIATATIDRVIAIIAGEQLARGGSIDRLADKG